MSTNLQTSDFRFFIDNVTIEKGKTEDGKEIMKVGGIATTKAKDTDGEEIDPNGWDVDYFLQNGFFNYNHQAKFNPKAVIGEPTKAKVTKDGVYVEGFLYPESELAKQVYETTELLEKSSSKRRMGFSIEGKALERDPFNPNKITKAKLTGCALTLNPKNPNTLVNIIKGEYHTDDFEISNEDLPEEAILNIEKAEDYLVHIEQDGRTLQVDKDLRVKITENKKIEKSMSTGADSAIIPEDVDQTVKNKVELPGMKKNLTKGEIYSEIFNYIYDVDLEKAELAYKLIEAVALKRTNMENTKVEITKDDIQKSLDIVLGVQSTEDSLEKGEACGTKAEGEEKEMTPEEKMEKAMSEDEKYQELKKACDSANAALEEYKSKIEKGEVSGYPTTVAAKEEKTQEPNSDPNASSIGKEGDFLNKSVVEELVKGLESTLEKGLGSTTDLVKSLAEATQGLLDQNNNLEKGLQESQRANEDLRKGLEETLSRLEKIENTPLPSRTVTSQNYTKHPTLEKSIDGNRNVLHAQQNYKEISDLLERKAGLDTPNPNMGYAAAMQVFETSSGRELEKSIVDDLRRTEGVDIIGL